MAARFPQIATEGDGTRPIVGFLFIGGEHQMLHTAPVAAELARGDACGSG